MLNRKKERQIFLTKVDKDSSLLIRSNITEKETFFSGQFNDCILY